MAYKAFDLSGKVAPSRRQQRHRLGMAEAMAQAGAGVCVWGTNEAKNAAALKRLKGARWQGPGAPLRRQRRGRGGPLLRRDGQGVRPRGRFLRQRGRQRARRATGGFAEMSTAEWRRVMSVNLDGAFFSLRAAARHMVERGGGGSLVSTASLAAVMGAARSEHYSATKGALMAMTGPWPWSLRGTRSAPTRSCRAGSTRR